MNFKWFYISAIFALLCSATVVYVSSVDNQVAAPAPASQDWSNSDAQSLRIN